MIKIFRCKFCKVQCHKDLKPVLGKEHKKCCPRRRNKG
jgi:hypothetical protein